MCDLSLKFVSMGEVNVEIRFQPERWFDVNIGFGLARFVVRAASRSSALENAADYCIRANGHLGVNPDSLFNSAEPLGDDVGALHERVHTATGGEGTPVILVGRQESTSPTSYDQNRVDYYTTQLNLPLGNAELN